MWLVDCILKGKRLDLKDYSKVDITGDVEKDKMITNCVNPVRSLKDARKLAPSKENARVEKAMKNSRRVGGGGRKKIRSPCGN